MREYDRALEIQPINAVVWLNRARALEAQERLEDA
ncbi:tetratricopeptide repeat protein, partial [Haemophilus parainfluenzae]